MSDFNLSVTVRNAHILRRIRDQYGSAAEMCRRTGMTASKVSAMLTMREKPFRQNGTLTAAAEELCSALRATPSELWPKDMAQIQAKKARYEIEMTQAEALAIAAPTDSQIIQRQLIEKWTESLSPRLLLALELSQSGMTLDEIGAELRVSRERARQIIHKAQRLVRQQAIKDGVRSYSEVAS